MILIDHITKKFGTLTALDRVVLALEGGKSYALIGPNGSGKTTLIKCVLGLVVPTSGTIFFEGKPILRDWKYREKIGYMPQIGHYPENMTVGQLFEMMKHIRPLSRLDEDLVGAFTLTKVFNKRMHTLSGGTRQKVSAALAFLFQAPVLILDEPTAGLDPIAVEILKEKISREKRLGKLIIVTSHILNDLDEITTEMVYMFEGRIQYNDSIESLKAETNEPKLTKAIATLIRQRELTKPVTDLP